MVPEFIPTVVESRESSTIIQGDLWHREEIARDLKDHQERRTTEDQTPAQEKDGYRICVAAEELHHKPERAEEIY